MIAQRPETDGEWIFDAGIVSLRLRDEEFTITLHCFAGPPPEWFFFVEREMGGGMEVWQPGGGEDLSPAYRTRNDATIAAVAHIVSELDLWEKEQGAQATTG